MVGSTKAYFDDYSGRMTRMTVWVVGDVKWNSYTCN